MEIVQTLEDITGIDFLDNLDEDDKRQYVYEFLMDDKAAQRVFEDRWLDKKVPGWRSDTFLKIKDKERI